MSRTTICDDAATAVTGIADGATVLVGGFGMAGGVPVISGGVGGFGTPTGTGTSTTNNNGATFSEGAIQVFEAGNAAATAVGVVDRIAERVAL